jgi:hypothetical protein
VRFLPLFQRHRVGLTREALLQGNGDKDGESTLGHHRPPPLLGPGDTKLDALLGSAHENGGLGRARTDDERVTRERTVTV